MDEQPLPKPGTPEPEQLDYALLQTATPAGGKALGDSPIGETAERNADKRGVIGLPAADWVFTPQARLFIVQHPEGAPMKLALETQAVIGMNANQTRVTYRTNTLAGSSGCRASTSTSIWSRCITRAIPTTGLSIIRSSTKACRSPQSGNSSRHAADWAGFSV